ncbi:fungal-specific transcription factor domain-containing protein [Xylariaceae sp. FL1019]|nr:fungal-specific transcription factor domain-containing protein [Xylariaceae sp. FL1019]
MSPKRDESCVSTPPAKRPRRSYVACNRCHTQKTKCTGEKPCRGCVRSGNSSQCTYPNRERKVTVLESYIDKLEAENAALKKATVSPSKNQTPKNADQAQDSVDSGGRATSDPTTDEDEPTPDMADPLLEDRLLTDRNQVFSRAVYIGGAACTAFATRLGSRAYDGQSRQSASFVVPMVKDASLLRSLDVPYALPNRAYTQVLVQVVLRFVGHDYHLLTKRTFMKMIDKIYEDPEDADQMSLCRLFVVLALGELYLKGTGTSDRGEKKVPGTQFFLTAVSLFREEYEEPDIDYIQTLLLLSFYSHALNRKNTAYTYAGLALRLSVTLGLHRNITYDANFRPIEIENRRRVWWTVYCFDRMCSSKLGHVPMIRDQDIDAPLPSSECLSTDEADDFVDAQQLIANVTLSRITGSILRLIYGATPHRAKDFVRNVHTVLNSLKQWESELPIDLKLDHNRFPSYKSRSVASLRLHFNQCIILTTRPILLHVFNHQSRSVHTPGSTRSGHDPKPLPPMTVALSEACIYAARASAKLLGQLWADGNIATFGYFDSHYLFSSIVILLISDALRANDEDHDAITLSSALLQCMVDDGNFPAREFHQRLSVLRWEIEKMKESSTSLMAGPIQGYVTSTGTFAANVNHGVKPDFRVDISGTASLVGKSSETGAQEGEMMPSAPLDAPFIQDFLGNFDQTWGAGVLDTPSNELSEWSLVLDNTDFL